MWQANLFVSSSTTVIQVYAPPTDYDDEQIENFYTQLQESINKVYNKDILFIQGEWNTKVGVDSRQEWKLIGPSCNNTTNDRG